VSPRRLYRSRSDRQLAGVAGGVAAYLDIDPVVIRILWILSVFAGGFGVLLYVIMAFIVPLEPVVAAGPGPSHGETANPS
jgi:phage shock protein C